MIRHITHSLRAVNYIVHIRTIEEWWILLINYLIILPSQLMDPLLLKVKIVKVNLLKLTSLKNGKKLTLWPVFRKHWEWNCPLTFKILKLWNFMIKFVIKTTSHVNSLVLFKGNFRTIIGFLTKWLENIFKQHMNHLW